MISLDEKIAPSTPDAPGGADADESKLNTFRRQFEDYANAKGREIDEQRLNTRYYHVDQWTAEQLRTLRKRGQPATTFDRTGRKIDSLAGTIRRLRTDPKCFPMVPRGEQGAEVATHVIRAICDASDAEGLEVECCMDAMIHGFGVDELMLVAGDKGDPDLRFNYVDPRTFFYDPRSTRPNFGDTRFHGVYKWVEKDELELLGEGLSEKVSDATAGDDGGYSTAFDTDREVMWVDSRNRIRLVDHWYRRGAVWRWCLHTGNIIVMQGDSPFFNQRGQSISKYTAFATMIDVDGDHYGFIRRLKGPQDAMNQHRSKAIHIMNTRQLKLKEGAVDDVEVTRREAARTDGTLVYRGDRQDLEVLQPEQEFIQQTTYYNDAKTEIDSFGPNHQLIQQFGQNVSGRAASALQQAGLAELGPFLKNFRMWKLDRYEKAWCGAQRYWTSERMLRVSGDQQVSQFMQVNSVQLDEYGLPQLVNMLGNIDVEIKVDEGPDTETVMGDVFDLLMALAQNNVPVPPAVIIEASSLPISEKQKLTTMINTPDPVKQQMTQLQLAAGQAEVQKTGSEAQKLQAEAGKAQSAAMLNIARAQTEGLPTGGGEPQKTPLDIAEQLAKINEIDATAEHKRANSSVLRHKAQMEPLRLIAEHMGKNADRTALHFQKGVDSLHRDADRSMEDFHRTRDRDLAAKQPPPQRSQP